MADYIYLLENRLSEGQRIALNAVRDVARAQGLTVFLVGGAVRDLTSGSPVRDLDVVVQGNASKLKKQIELSGGVVVGDNAAAQALFVRFPGGIRVEIGSTLSATYPKPGKAVLKPATILDDLRRRDFTANAMALSLNEGSYGLLMDPLNGVADIENRQLRLVSSYGFIEDPVRMIRAVRFAARLGWAMDEKTKSRYDTSKSEDHIGVLGDFARGYETEEIFHEEDPLLVLRRLEEEGWMKHLFTVLTLAKANATELEKLREIQTQLQMRGIHPHAAASNFPLLTAKFSSKEVAELKHSFVRPGFVKEIESLDAAAKEFAAQLLGKTAAAPSQAWKLLMSAKPEAVLWVAYSSKSGAIQAKFKNFQTEWPQARNKIPYTLMQEMRITPELPGYEELVEKLFFELMDGKLGTIEEMKAFLDSYSPPAPPPTVHLRRARAAKKEAKSRKKPVATIEGEAESKEVSSGTDVKNKEGDNVKGVPPVAVKAAPAKAKAAPVKTAKATAKTVPAKSIPVAAKAAAVKTPVKNVPAVAKKTVVTPHKQAAPARKVVAKTPVKAAPKKAVKAVVKAVVKAAVKPVPAKKSVPAKKAVPVKKPSTLAGKVVAKKPVPVKKAATAKATPAKKATPAHKPAPTKKAAPKKRR